MKNKFTVKIAKEIAERQFDQVLDCVSGLQDPDLNFYTETYKFEDLFTEDLEERNIAVTPKRIAEINKQYEKLVERDIKAIDKLYSKPSKTIFNQTCTEPKEKE